MKDIANLEYTPELEGAFVDDPVVVTGPRVGVSALFHGLGGRSRFVVVLIVIVLEPSTALRSAILAD